jgi:hypothetical protein
MAANAPQLVEATLFEAILEGVAVVSKKKLLWMLGWTNDKPKAWSDLRQHWERMGRNPKELHCTEIRDKVLIISVAQADKPEVLNIAEWAD